MLNILFRPLQVLCRVGRGLSFALLKRTGRVAAVSSPVLHVPLVCDGAGLVQMGSRVSLGYGLAAMVGNGSVRLQARAAGAVIQIGDETCFSNNVQVIAAQRISIGARCLIGDAVLIFDSDFHNLEPAERHAPCTTSAAVVIEDNVFIGSRAIILKGVTVGKGSVIGAGSVVVSSVPPGVIVAGNPAKVIRSLA